MITLDQDPEGIVATADEPIAHNDDHPDPVTLTEPEHDSQGLLRWSSTPRLDRS